MDNERRTPRVAYTLAEFCEAHRISRAHFYDLEREGMGPRRMRGVGARVVISLEAAREWRERMERETGKLEETA